MKKTYLLILFAILTASTAMAQRFTDNLDRGLVAVNMGSSTFLSWRILAHEYFGVTYNVYRDGTKVNAVPLTVSNYIDSSVGTSYTVSAVVDGVEQAQSTAISPWTNMDTGGAKTVSSATYPGYIDITLARVLDRTNTDVTETATGTINYVANDAIFADLNGDRDLEFIIKRMNLTDANNFYPESNTTAYDVIEAYDVDYSTGQATRMWWIDCGPNMVSLNSTEINFLAYDWDEDGIAEVVLRGADNMIVHTSTGGSIVIGTPGVNTRGTITHAANATFTNTGKEYLIYLNGQTGETYQVMEYPLKRIEDSEYNAWSGTYTEAQMEQKAWGTGILGHRSSKYYMGAPFLDGRSASLFLARGIYTRHKMIAMDLGSNHQWQTRWTWSCNDPSSDWYGQGFHNYVIADVDDDGKDEIMYGSMVIDDNGKGLHTTGYGHGDAMHVGDFDPYRPGPELYVCLEENPYWGSAYRSGTTGEIYYKYTSNPTAEELAADAKAGDDGRCMAGNFLNDYPGGEARSVGSGLISCVKDQELFSSSSSPFEWYQCNFRIYWDGDLLDELLYNSSYPDKDLKLDKPGSGGGRLFTSTNCQLNNDSKCNPCFSGDVLGDWREEILMRSGTNVRLYTTTIPTTHAMPSLWFDHQYRQAMGTQMQVYNQPPHVSYFMGELENITVAPPPLTMSGRREVSNGGTISTDMDGEDLLMCGYANQTYTFSGKISPRSIVINVPAWIQGNNNNNITTTTYTHTLTYSGSDAGIKGNTYFVKQGLGTLNMPKKTLSYTGPTEIWGGTVKFDGTLSNSKVWMNRHTTLNTTGGTFSGGLTMEYGSTLNLGGETSGAISTATVSDLTLNYGSQVVFDVAGTNQGDNDLLTVNGTLTIDQKTGDNWKNYGPANLVPVFVLRSATTLESGDYPLAVVEAFGNNAATDIAKIKLNTDGLKYNHYATLRYDNSTKILYLHLDESTTPDYFGELNINVTGMSPCHVSSTDYPSAANETFYLPVVSISAPPFSSETPTLSGKFTALDGTETYLGSSGDITTFYSQNYESATDASSWTNGAGTIELVTGDATYGKYIHHSMVSTGIAANRSAYTLFGSLNLSDVSQYYIEFDARIASGNVADRSATDLVVMTSDAIIPTTKNIGYDFTQNNGTNANYLFRMNAANSQVFTINDSENTITLNASSWYHIKLAVDVETKKVNYTISQAGTTTATGTYTVTTASCLPMGLFILDGRGSGDSKFDNIQIYKTKDFSSYKFTKPGTLTLTASVPGYQLKTETFTVPAVYYKYYESPDYQTATIAELGSSYYGEELSSTKNIWPNWNSEATTYYETVEQGPNTKIYFDSDEVVYGTRTGSGANWGLIPGYGLNTSRGLFISVDNLGDENTIIYYRTCLNNGTVTNTDYYVNADENGKFSINTTSVSPPRAAFCKFTAYVPVVIHDELATTLPQAVETQGNAQVWRNGLTSTSTWATMVVPFDMTAAQVREVFGNGVTVANLNTEKGTEGLIYFETIDVATASDSQTAITANKPCLIKGVTKTAPYLIMGITSEPVQEPSVNNGLFTFVGTYIDLGQHAFYTTDYFFTTTGLSRVETDGIKMRFKGYRGYFKGLTANGAKNIQAVFDETDVVTEIHDETNTRNEVYDLQGRRIPENWQLKKGVYIVNGRKTIVK